MGQQMIGGAGLLMGWVGANVADKRRLNGLTINRKQ